MTQERQTAATFREKWTHNPDLAFRQTLDEKSEIFRWILGRNGFSSSDELDRFLSDKARILDAGCGNGRVTALLRQHAPMETEIVAVDLTAADVARENLAGLDRISVHDGDLLGDLSALGEFDFIYCQEVLHHTSDPGGALHNLSARLAPHGEIAIYVYRRKAPIREFADDYVRDQISGLLTRKQWCNVAALRTWAKNSRTLGQRSRCPDRGARHRAR